MKEPSPQLRLEERDVVFGDGDDQLLRCGDADGERVVGVCRQ